MNDESESTLFEPMVILPSQISSDAPWASDTSGPIALTRTEGIKEVLPSVAWDGQEYVIAWKPESGLETTVVGLAKPPIADKTFAAAVFGIWLGEKPIQDDIKKGLVSRAGELIK